MTLGLSTPAWAKIEVESPWFLVGSEPTAVRLLRDGVEAFPAMLEAIARAETEILLEIYWIGDDAVGEVFRDALVAKAREGVIVRVVYDAIGSLGLPASFFRELEIAGGEVRDFHPLSPFRPAFDLTRIEERDHRKLLVVDKEIGFTGGLNLARPWLPVHEGGEGWRDDMIEVRGRPASELRTLFYKTWRRIHTSGLLPFFVPDSVARGPKDLVPLGRRPTAPIFVLASLRRSRRNLRREYLSRIHRATSDIAIANSYFIPDHTVRHALYRAVSRGVRVRILVPRKSDIAIAQFALEAMYEQLLRHGVELYAHAGPMMHAKTLVIDDRFAMIGSYNIDERSRRKNLEASVAVDDVAFATHVRTWFDHDVLRAERVDLETWRKRSLVRRVAETFAYALRKLW